MSELGKQLRAEGYEPLRVVSINVSEIAQRVRQNAKKAKLDLTGAFLRSLDDLRLLEVLNAQAERRERVNTEVAKATQADEDDLARAKNQNDAGRDSDQIAIAA